MKLLFSHNETPSIIITMEVDDLAVFFKELERELKLRIPDKFLKVHRWR